MLNCGELKFEGSPDEMINLARGKVWEIFVTDMEYEEIKDKYPIISTIPTDGGMEIQVVADAIDGYSAQSHRTKPRTCLRLLHGLLVERQDEHAC